MFWIPYYGRGNEVVRLNPKTAELTRFPLPFAKTAGIHSAIPAPDGTVWFTEAALGNRAFEPAHQGDHRISEFAAARRQAHRRAHHSGR